MPTPEELIQQLRREFSAAVPWTAAETVHVTFPSSPDTDLRVPHNLGTTNVAYEVLGASKACTLYHDVSPTREAWTPAYIVVRCDAADAELLLRLSVPSTLSAPSDLQWGSSYMPTAIHALNGGMHSGLLDDGQLSSNVPLKNGANTFSAVQTFTGGAAGLGWHDVQAYGAVGDGVTDDTAAIQDALDAAAATGALVFIRPGLTYATSDTLTILSPVVATGATISYTGSGTALVVGQATPTLYMSFLLPAVVKADKAATGWDAASVGVKLLNLNTCSVDVPLVQGFTTGLYEAGEAAGNAQNTIRLGGLQTNKVNLLIDSTGTGGYCNENTHLGGRLWHVSDEGSDVSGTKHIQIASSGTTLANNHKFFGQCVESGVAEYQLDVVGSDNLFVGLRYEGTPRRVRFSGATSVGNLIIAGVYADSLTLEQVSSAKGNSVIGTVNHRFESAAGDGGVMRLANLSSDAHPAVMLYELAEGAHTANPSTAYNVALGVGECNFKARASAYPRIRLYPTYGIIELGTGAAAPDVSFSRTAANTLGMAAGDHVKVDGTWNGGHWLLGSYHLWVDGTGALRIKSSAPTGDTDGTVVGSQT